MKIFYAINTDIDDIKNIADKNRKYIGFVMKPILLEAIKQNRVIILKENNKIIGFCHFRKRKKDGVTVIYEICLLEEYTNNSLGNLFLKFLNKPILAKCPIDNYSNKFYLKNNFKLINIEEGKKRKLNVWKLV